MELLLAPKPKQPRLVQVHLPRPKDGQLQQFLWDEEGLELYEMVEHFDPHRSWFLDNQLAQRGHFRVLTKLDPLYLFLPHLQRLAAHNYRSLADICTTFNEERGAGGSRLDFALRPDIDWAQVCDTKEVDQELYVRFSESRTRSWLKEKHARVMAALGKELGEQTNVGTLKSTALELVALYLDPNWTKTLQQSL